MLCIYTWNLNDPCFDWQRPCFWGLKPKNRGQTGSRYIYLKQPTYDSPISTRVPSKAAPGCEPVEVPPPNASHPPPPLPSQLGKPWFFLGELSWWLIPKNSSFFYVWWYFWVGWNCLGVFEVDFNQFWFSRLLIAAPKRFRNHPELDFFASKKIGNKNSMLSLEMLEYFGCSFALKLYGSPRGNLSFLKCLESVEPPKLCPGIIPWCNTPPQQK